MRRRGSISFASALRERRAPGSTPLITLKEGDGLPPIFFIHGVGGNLVEILPTARRVTYPGAVIGVRARGVIRGETPHTSIEAMAADYLREIKKRQPNGPYYLCGYSSGGLAAFEIARRLSESGDEVGLVGLFRYDDESGAMAITDLARDRRSADGTPRRRICAPCPFATWPSVPAQVRRAAFGRGVALSAPRLQSESGWRQARSSPPAKVPPGFYRGELTAVLARRDGSLASRARGRLAQACPNCRRRRDTGNTPDDALSRVMPRRLRMCDAVYAWASPS
jgi:pimeloyl-ACP methyl ester carboxylesterase